MRVRLLGTGASDGWPDPWCGCASCLAAARAGVVRGQTSALVDDRLLLDVGPEAPRSALRQGTSFRDLVGVLVTHAHEDHFAGAVWMWRSWQRPPRPLVVVAPPAVASAVRKRAGGGVDLRVVTAGDEVRVGPYDVRVLPAAHADASVGPAVLYDVTGPDGARLLWGTDTGPLPDDAVRLVAGRRYDAVLLELTSSGTPGHLDLRTWPEQVAELRRVGAVTDRTCLLAVHLGHGNPPPAELDARLAEWGARAPRDGDVVEVGAQAAPPVAREARRVLVLGGARSGKSAHAESLLAAEPEVVYAATAPERSDDADWEARVAAHRARRPAAWRTVETGDVVGLLDEVEEPLLVDDLGLWLVRVVDGAQAWERDDPRVDEACDALVAAWGRRRGTAVLVAPQVGGGVVPAAASGRRFRDLLGGLTTRLAAGSDEVVEVVAGLPRRLR